MSQSIKSKLTPTNRSLPISLLRTRELLMKDIRPILQRHKITDQQWRVLRVIDESEHAIGASIIADRACLLAPSLTRILRALVKIGFIEVNQDSRDKRRMYAQLTDKGTALIKRVAIEVVETFAKLRTIVGEERWETLIKELIEIREVINKSQQTKG